MNLVFLQKACIILCSILFSLGIFYPSLSSKWAPIDDHEIVTFLNGKKNISLRETVSLWTRKERGKGRFRPLYIFLRIGEVGLWGDNLFLWYLTRLSIFTFSCITVWYILSHLLGFVLGFMLTIWLFSSPFWGDIIARLGPSESYSLLGLTLFTLSLFNVVRNSGIQRISLFGMAVGYTLAIFTKENMVFIFVPAGMLYIWLFLTKKAQYLHWIFLLLCGVTLIAISGILKEISKTGMDVYNNPATAESRIPLIIEVLKTKTSILSLTLTFSSLLYLVLKKQTIKYIWIFFCFLCSFLLFTSQYVFYSGNFPTASRYDMPGMFYKLLIVAPLLYITFQFVEQIKPIRKYKKVIYIFICIAMMIGSKPLKIQALHSYSRQYAHMAINFTDAIKKSLNFMHEYPTGVIIIESTSVEDVEAIHSIQVLFRHANAKPKLFIRVHRNKDQQILINQSLANKLEDGIQKTSLEGTDMILPLKELPTDVPCFSLSLNYLVSNECIETSVVPTRWH